MDDEKEIHSQACMAVVLSIEKLFLVAIENILHVSFFIGFDILFRRFLLSICVVAAVVVVVFVAVIARDFSFDCIHFASNSNETHADR